MKRTTASLFASLALFVASPAWAQNTAPKSEKPAAQPSVQPAGKPATTIEKKPAEKKPAEDKAADNKAGEPGPNHKLLAQFEGEWDTVTTEFGEDGKPASTDKGTTTAKVVMGGRFLDFSYDGRSHGKFARGAGMMGYSNVEKRFEQYYAQSTSTEIEYMTGSADSAGKVFTFSGKTTDAAGKAISKKSVITITSKDACKEEVYVTAGGKETKVAELVYTRESKSEKKNEVQPKIKPAPAADPANKK